MTEEQKEDLRKCHEVMDIYYNHKMNQARLFSHPLVKVFMIISMVTFFILVTIGLTR